MKRIKYSPDVDTLLIELSTDKKAGIQYVGMKRAAMSEEYMMLTLQSLCQA